MLYNGGIMASIDKIRASDGSGNASLATVQSTRAALASTIVVDTVLGINGNFMGTMGTPHTFTDPVTSETITVISEATAVDFAGHVDGSNLEIDEIAPGYTDNGSEVGDIVIIRPTSQWADNVADVLDVAHNDDGTLKDGAVSSSDKLVDGIVTSLDKLTFSGARVRSTSPQVIPNTTYTTLTFGTEEYDTNSYHDTGSNPERLTVPSDGYYTIGTIIGFATWAGTSRMIVLLKKNGLTLHELFDVYVNSTSEPSITLSVDVKAFANDYFELQVFQDTAASRNVSATAWISSRGR